jgi:hypothetical protein
MFPDQFACHLKEAPEIVSRVLLFTRTPCIVSLGLQHICLMIFLAGLKKFLKKNVKNDTLAVLDAKLGGAIKEKLGLNCLQKCGPA